LTYKGIMAIYWVLLARVMSVDGLGVIALANAIAMPAYVIVDAGLTAILVRDYSESNGLLRSHARRVKTRLAFGLFLVLPLSGAGYLLGDHEAAAGAVAMMSLAYFFDFTGQLMLAPSRSAAVMEPDATVRFIQAFGTVAATLLLIKADLISPGWIAAASTVAYAIAILPAARVWRRSRRWSDHPKPGSEARAETTPVTIGTILMTIFSRADSLIVQGILGPAALASYTVAYKLLEVARLVPGALARIVLAHASASDGGDRGAVPEGITTEELSTEIPAVSQVNVDAASGSPGSYDPRRLLRTSMVMSGFATLFTVLLGPIVIGVLFGADYKETSTETMRVMGLSLVPFAVVTVGSMYAVGSGQATVYARIALEALVVMVILVPALALLFGLTGAAIGMLLSYTFASLRFWKVMQIRDSMTVAQ
jgi:O-antigen/teichoic acid export membrane protein